MDPKDIAKIISEDITVNNGKLYEDINGIPIDGDSKIDQFLKIIDREYINLDINDEKFKKLWAKYFHYDINTAADIIRHSSQSSRAAELADILNKTIQQKPNWPGTLKNFEVTIDNLGQSSVRKYEIEAPNKIYAVLQAMSLSRTGDNIPWGQFNDLKLNYGKSDVAKSYPLIQTLAHVEGNSNMNLYRYRVYDEDISYDNIRHVLANDWSIILPLP